MVSHAPIITPGTPHMVPETLIIALGTRHMALQAPNMSPGAPHMVPEALNMAPETPHMIPEAPNMALETPNVVPEAQISSPFFVFGEFPKLENIFFSKTGSFKMFLRSQFSIFFDGTKLKRKIN